MKKAIAAFVLLAFGIGMFVAMSQLRQVAWKNTQQTTRRGGPVTEEQLLIEEEIAKVADETLFDRMTDIRYIMKLPIDPIRIEAAHRQRRTDSAEALPSGEPLLLQQFSLGLTARDKFRREPIPAARRQVLTVGLSMLDIDQQSLPPLSRNAIMDFIEQHYMSIQARIMRDPVTEKWILHHRPIALVAKYRNLPLTQDFNETLSKTVSDMRGIGIYKPQGINSESKTQTAVWLFRSDWIDPGMGFAMPRLEYVFIHAVPENDSEDSPLRMHVFCTTQQRTLFHYLGDRGQMQQPDRPGKVDVLGTIAITGYTSNGLTPSTSASRDVRIQGAKHYTLPDIERHLKEKGIELPWNEALVSLFESMIDGSLPQSELSDSLPAAPGK